MASKPKPYNKQMSRYLAGMARQAPVPSTPEHAVALMTAASMFAVAESINDLTAMVREMMELAREDWKGEVERAKQEREDA